MTWFTLETEGKETKSLFHDTPYGALDEEAGRRQLDSGRRLLLQSCLKPFVETGRQPHRPDSLTDADSKV